MYAKFKRNLLIRKTFECLNPSYRRRSVSVAVITVCVAYMYTIIWVTYGMHTLLICERIFNICITYARVWIWKAQTFDRGLSQYLHFQTRLWGVKMHAKMYSAYSPPITSPMSSILFNLIQCHIFKIEMVLEKTFIDSTKAVT